MAVFVPPMTGLSTEEPVYQRPKLDQLLGLCKPGEIIRNLLVEAHQAPAWDALHDSIKRLFGYDILPPDATGADILRYRDAVTARFDPTMTLLCKAYNLQHLDLSVQSEKQAALCFCITLTMSPPTDYRGLIEYDFYSLFTEETRSLPLLREFESIEVAEAGLIRLAPEAQGAASRDCFAILLSGGTDFANRHGWLPLNPSRFFDVFLKFKESILLNLA